MKLTREDRNDGVMAIAMITQHCRDIAAAFPGRAFVTIIVRNPDLEPPGEMHEAAVVVSAVDDDLDLVIDTIRHLQRRFESNP